LPGNGLIVANAAEAALERVLVRGCWTPVERFNCVGGWQAAAPASDGAFDIVLAGQVVGRVSSPLTGAHNRANVIAALMAARHVGVPLAAGIASMSRFKGIRRRLEIRGEAGGVIVYDDFAHHPTAIFATIAGLRERIGHSRILAVLEPRSNTMKLGVMKAQLPGSLAEADCVFCYSANLGWDACAALAPLGAVAQCFDDLATLVAAVATAAIPGDHVLVMSNGGFGGVHGRLLDALSD
jgi:UDP-N-acetylmuramate: L-alanyl-gamma-D-glutamyl-meso-diaminopimelate ligase